MEHMRANRRGESLLTGMSFIVSLIGAVMLSFFRRGSAR